eukprot:5536493-Prymnesium_polylepis.1
MVGTDRHRSRCARALVRVLSGGRTWNVPPTTSARPIAISAPRRTTPTFSRRCTVPAGTCARCKRSPAVAPSAGAHGRGGRVGLYPTTAPMMAPARVARSEAACGGIVPTSHAPKMAPSACSGGRRTHRDLPSVSSRDAPYLQHPFQRHLHRNRQPGVCAWRQLHRGEGTKEAREGEDGEQPRDELRRRAGRALCGQPRLVRGRFVGGGDVARHADGVAHPPQPEEAKGRRVKEA